MFSLRIETENAAFCDDLTGEPAPAPEVARILRDLADRIEAEADAAGPFRLRDINGNTVGTAETLPDAPG